MTFVLSLRGQIEAFIFSKGYRMREEKTQIFDPPLFVPLICLEVFLFTEIFLENRIIMHKVKVHSIWVSVKSFII
jgi:hypothetical protein